MFSNNASSRCKITIRHLDVK